MKIMFIEDYKGRETAMRQYRADDIEFISKAQALALIKLGVAVEEIPKKTVKKAVKDDTDAP